MHDDLSAAVDALFPDVRNELESLVRIPSVSLTGYDPADVRRSAEATAALLEEAGLSDVRLLELGDAHPAVYGHKPGPEGAPTVLLYAHHDVQPPGDPESWTVAPFEPMERDGRLYGRGSSDDKAGIVVHTGAIRALGDEMPVSVKVFVEGEEEIGSTHLEGFLAEYGDLLAADVIVIADSGNWRVGVPALTTSLRGLVSTIVEVETLENGVHSGMFGGAVPDALTVLTRVLATLHDERGNVAVPGLVTGEAADLDLSEAELRSQAGTIEGLELIGEGSLTTRLWMKPAISVVAIDAPPLSEAINQLVPRARAKVSMRIAPGQDPAAAMQALVDHIEGQNAWGARVTATPHESGEAFMLSADDPRTEAFRSAFSAAWDTDTVDIGVGGSIPFVAAFSERYPDAAILLTGVADPTSRAHGPDESVDLDELRRGILAEAIALRNLGA
jgi:acetylornithine deacetylase/succinyl-diaminopimelate desuccinylase-like protein